MGKTKRELFLENEKETAHLIEVAEKEQGREKAQELFDTLPVIKGMSRGAWNRLDIYKKTRYRKDGTPYESQGSHIKDWLYDQYEWYKENDPDRVCKGIKFEFDFYKDAYCRYLLTFTDSKLLYLVRDELEKVEVNYFEAFFRLKERNRWVGDLLLGYTMAEVKNNFIDAILESEGKEALKTKEDVW